MAIGQSRFPLAIDGPTELLRAANGARGQLAASVSADAAELPFLGQPEAFARFPPDGPLSVGHGDAAEVVYYAAKGDSRFTGCLRGQDGTAPRAHAAREPIELRLVAGHLAARDSAIIAIEAALGANLGNVGAAVHGPSVHDDRYYTETEADARYALQSQLHAPVTVQDSSSIDLTLTGQQVAAAAIFGATAGTVAQGNDARFSDARTPTAHQATHQSGGSDALGGLLDAVARTTWRRIGTFVGSRRGVNLIPGSNVTIDVADDATNERVNVTIGAAAASGDVVRTVPYQQQTPTVASTTDATNYSTWLTTTAVLPAGTWELSLQFVASYFATVANGGPNVRVAAPVVGTAINFITAVNARAMATCVASGTFTSDGTAATTFRVEYRRHPTETGTVNAEGGSLLAICRKVG